MSSQAAIESKKACAHCGLPVPKRRALQEPAFCCHGCATVYQVLQNEGLNETYYRLREASSSRSLRLPARTKLNEPLLDELDSDVFAESHSVPLDGGVHRTHLYLDGVHCAACVWLIERMPQEISGVRSAYLNLPRARLTLEWDPSKAKLSSIARWLARFGYGVESRVDGEEAPETREERRLLIKMGISWALAGNIMLIAFALYSGLDSETPGLFKAARWTSFALAIPSLLVGGSVFFSRAFQSIRTAYHVRSFKQLHMDTPISLGILVGFIASAWATFTGTGDVWFDSISVLIAALLSARWLQLRARRLAGNSTEQLLALIPSITRREDELGGVAKVRTEELQVDDVVVVRPGELIPADGSILSGSALINAAILTGESKPERKETGDKVFAGTTSESEVLRIRVHAIGAHSHVGKLLSWVSEDRSERPVILSWVNQVGGWFTAASLTLALLTAVIWWVIDAQSIVPHVISLLVITCPCALGMATPLALAVGMGRAARNGIFIKSEAVLEWLTKVNVVVLDKTGTVTEGQMAVEQTELINASYSMNDIMLMAASLELQSVHPISQAFQQWADGQQVHDPTDVSYEPGHGISGKVNGHFIRVGSPDWIGLSEDFFESEYHFTAYRAALAAGQTVIVVEIGGKPAAWVSLSDPLRKNAASLVSNMQRKGLKVILCSGDHQSTTTQTGKALGLSEADCLGRYTPHMKKDLVSKLIAEGNVVAMIGDGVNDSAALQTAHVGIAVTDGTSASRQAADAFTTRSGLEAITELFQESGKVMRVIFRNLYFSLGYNAFGATLAIMGLVTPIVAAIAMPVSSLWVVISSITQRTFVPKS